MKEKGIIFLILFFPLVAFAQDPTFANPEVVVEETPQWVNLVIGILTAVVASGALSTFVSSDKWWMKMIDALAMNWGKARNDPSEQ